VKKHPPQREINLFRSLKSVIRCEQASSQCFPRVLMRGTLLDGPGDNFATLNEIPDHNVLLGAEVPEERPARDTCRCDNLVNGRHLETLRQEQLEREMRNLRVQRSPLSFPEGRSNQKTILQVKVTPSAILAHSAFMISNYTDQTVLVTGASSGIGSAFAHALAERGAYLVLVARREDRLHNLAEELRTAHGVIVSVISMDLSSPTVAPDLQRAVLERGLRITSLINNAGFGSFGPFIEQELPRLIDEIAVDVTAPVSLSSVFLPDLLKAGNGFLINLASMAAYTPAPRMAVYAASKAFVLNFTEALWAETRDTGVTVFALSPGATNTEFNAVVGTDDATAGARMRTAGQVVATALKHLERRNPGPSVIDGTGNQAGAAVSKLLNRRAIVTAMNRVTDPQRSK